MNWNGFVLETERLSLKVVDESAAPLVLDFYDRNQEFFRRWDPVRDDEFYTVKFHRDLLRTELTRINNGDLFKAWIFKQGEDQRTIGLVAYNNIVRGNFHSCFLGYKIDGSEANHGYMTEAVQAMNQFAFDTLKLHRIEANIIPFNTPSRRVTEKLGFTYEGLSHRYLRINGKWEDHVHMVLLNEEME